MIGAHERRRGSRWRLALALAVVVCAALLIAALSTTTSRPGIAASTMLSRCVSSTGRVAMRDCYVAAMLREVRPARRPTAVLERIRAQANGIGGYPAANCHVLMHTVGRRYARVHHVSLGNMMDYLPRTNDAGCAAGFAHGMITAIAPAVVRAGATAVKQQCAKSATRYQRYSCTHGLGHAYMRFYGESLPPSLRLCEALGIDAAADCAQGVYHDYWLAVIGSDETRPPPAAMTDARALCGRQPRGFVLPCWYRAFVETRPVGYKTTSAADLTRICAGTSGLQRQGCVTAASVIGSPNPLRQMRVCSTMPNPDVLACVHGVKVQNLIDGPGSNQLRVIRRCSWFSGRLASGCYEWLGKVLTVITDGRFARTGCPKVADRAACSRGARSFNGALVTFS